MTAKKKEPTPEPVEPVNEPTPEPVDETAPMRPGLEFVNGRWKRLPEDHPNSLTNIAKRLRVEQFESVRNPSDDAILAKNGPRPRRQGRRHEEPDPEELDEDEDE